MYGFNGITRVHSRCGQVFKLKYTTLFTDNKERSITILGRLYRLGMDFSLLTDGNVTVIIIPALLKYRFIPWVKRTDASAFILKKDNDSKQTIEVDENSLSEKTCNRFFYFF